MRNDDVAADIAQDVLVRSIAAGALQNVDNPTAWLYRSARNAVIDHYRTRHIHDPLDQAVDQWPEPAPDDNRPNEATRDLAGCLQPLAAQLPDIYREALERVDLAGQSHHAAAAELNISTSGMKSRVQRARRQLKELLHRLLRRPSRPARRGNRLPPQNRHLRLPRQRLTGRPAARQLPRSCPDICTRERDEIGRRHDRRCSPRNRRSVCGSVPGS